MKHTPIYRTIGKDVRKQFPVLRKCVSATEASKIMFGVKTLPHMISINAEKLAEIKSFFNNPSDLVEWAKNAKIDAPHHSEYHKRWTQYLDFHAKPDDFKAYKEITKLFGIQVAVSITQDRDCSDTLRAFTFLRADKKLWDKFNREIVQVWNRFPAAVKPTMLHDYGMDVMKKQEVKDGPKTVALPTLPAFDIAKWVSFSPSQNELQQNPQAKEIRYNIWVPRNSADLRKIGNAQNHCVGTQGMGYHDKIKRGHICIVAIYQKKLSDGICVEIDLRTLDVLQAQGRLRRGPTSKELEVIDDVIRDLKEMDEKVA